MLIVKTPPIMPACPRGFTRVLEEAGLSSFFCQRPVCERPARAYFIEFLWIAVESRHSRLCRACNLFRLRTHRQGCERALSSTTKSTVRDGGCQDTAWGIHNTNAGFNAAGLVMSSILAQVPIGRNKPISRAYAILINSLKHGWWKVGGRISLCVLVL